MAARQERSTLARHRTAAAPRVTCCLPWYVVFLVLIAGYGAFIYHAYSNLQQQRPSSSLSHKPSGTGVKPQSQKETEKKKRRPVPYPQLPAEERDRMPRVGVKRHNRPPHNHNIQDDASAQEALNQARQAKKKQKQQQQQSDPHAGVSLEVEAGVSKTWQSSSLWHEAAATSAAEVQGSYRTLLGEMETKLGAKLGKSQLTSCRRQQGTSSYSTDPWAACRGGGGGGGPFYYYNPLPNQARIVCGTSIPPKQVLERDALCHEPATSRLYPTLPGVTGAGMPPVVTRLNQRLGGGTTPLQAAKPFDLPCDVPCHHSGQFKIMSTRTIDGTNWIITMSMEGPEYYSNLHIDKQAWQEHRFYSTTSFQSEIPLPYYSRAEYKLWDGAPAVSFDRAIHGAVFMARNCHSRNNREQVVQDLQDLAKQAEKAHDDTVVVVRVDSVSSCLHNAEAPPGANLKDKNSVMQQYLFYLAFENQNVDDYITEKLWGPLEAGTVPIYLGAPNVHNHAPDHSLIAVHDFPNTAALYTHLQAVARNKTLYESYHAWRTQPALRRQFDAKLQNVTASHGTCRTCKWAYARLYGLGWNHDQQQVRDLRNGLSRQVCVDSATGLLQQPVVETWGTAAGGSSTQLATQRRTTTAQSSSSSSWLLGAASSSATTTTCLKGTLAQDALTVEKEGTQQLLRIVRQVDGVTDWEVHALTAASSSLLLPVQVHLQTPLASSGSATNFTLLQPGHARLQTSTSRVTVLAWPPTVALKAADATSAVVTVTIHTLPVKLRIVVEDVDTFHAGAEHAENYFGSVVRKDFYYPVEVFYDGAAR